MPEQPNIVFILFDQMRKDCLGIVGHPVVETPNIDFLGHQGVVFTHAYSTCPSCIAARASMFTGLTPSSHGRLGYKDQVPWRYRNMLPDVLGRHGYQTHCVGKTHLYPQRAHCGFHSLDSYEGCQNFDGLYVNDYFAWLKEKSNGLLEERMHGMTSNAWHARPSHLPEELHNNTWVATRGIEFLKRRDKTRPFFLNLSFHRPHPPIDPPRRFYDMYKDRALPPVPVGDWAHIHDVPVDHIDAWHGTLDEKILAHTRRAYYAQVAHIDSQIGRFLQALEHMKTGPTAVVLTADHGEMLGDHHMFRKCYAYEGSAGVPLVIMLPGEKRGKMCDVPTAHEDIYPTVLETAGIAIPEQAEGHSLLSLYRNPEANLPREYVHGEHSAFYTEEEAMQFLTDGKEKYIWFTLTGREQLFNLADDPGELHDLANASSARERLELWRKRMVEKLAARSQDGLSDGTKLIPGKLLPAVRE